MIKQLNTDQLDRLPEIKEEILVLLGESPKAVAIHTSMMRSSVIDGCSLMWSPPNKKGGMARFITCVPGLWGSRLHRGRPNGPKQEP
jgi:hypothetical protein